MRAALLAVLVLLGSLSVLPVSGAAAVAPLDGTPQAAQTDAPPDPETDVIGWENGVWYNESIPVDQTGLGDQGLTDRETELLVARTMARVEVLRQLEFTSDVTVEYISRAELKERLENTSFGETTNQQVYEALFIFGEDTDSQALLESYLGNAVVGYAAEEGSANLTIITRNEDLQAVSETVLAHELVHVLQHQRFDLSQPRYRRSTLDGEWGKDGLIEGEASYIDSRYQQQCISNWSCTSPPSDWSGASVPSGVRAYGLLSQQPYQDGATWVYETKQAGGWAAVNRAHQDPPESTEQIIHLDRSRDPVPMTVEDHSTTAWEPYHTNTLGEAAMFAMFFAQRERVEEGKQVLERDPFERQHRWDTLDFDFEPSAGWGNDTFRAYRNGEREGFTWTSVWDSERDAKEFAGAYERALTGLGAWRYGNHTYIIEEGPFADAYHVEREGERVHIVNAPTVEELSEVDTRVDTAANPYVEHLRERIEKQNETIEQLRERLAEQNETIQNLKDGGSGGEGAVETPWTPGLVVLAVVLVAVLFRRRA